MAKNTSKWLRRSKKKFSTAQQAWEDIESTTDYTKRSVKAIHTKYFWRWKVTRLNATR
jgi:hypothetical protein